MKKHEVNKISRVLELIEIYGYLAHQAERMMDHKGNIKPQYAVEFFYRTQTQYLNNVMEA